MKSYLGWAGQLAQHYPNTPIPDLDSRQVLDFFIHLQTERQLAGATLNQALCALRTFYRDHLGKTWKIWAKIKFKREEPLPHVLTREEIAKLLGTLRSGRYRAYFTLVYHCGLRMSECLQISPKDIDGKRCVLRVLNTKGGKPREVPISQDMVEKLRTYWKWHRNPDWLFPGPGRG